MKKIERLLLENGVTFTVGKVELECSLRALTPEMVSRLAVHGLNQKVGDSAAGLKTDAEILSALKATLANLTAGVWNSSGRGTSSMLAEAVSRVMSITVAEAVAKLEKLDDEEHKKVTSHPKVMLEMLKIKSERTKLAAEGASVEGLASILS